MDLMSDAARPASAPPGFHLLAKPSGSTCNIDCTYCFFLSKDALYPNEKHRMSEETLEALHQAAAGVAQHADGYGCVAGWRANADEGRVLQAFSRTRREVSPARSNRCNTLSRPTASFLMTSGAPFSRNTIFWSGSARRPPRDPRHLQTRSGQEGNVRQGNEGLALSAQAQCRLQRPVHGECGQRKTWPHGLSFLSR